MADLQLQSEVFENIKTLCVNYKKDGDVRKTPDYLTKRLISLENQWKDFEDRHQLLMKLEDKETKYFQENIYEKTKQLYDSTKRDILQKMLTTTSATSSTTELPGLVEPATESNLTSKTKELLQRQECNFKAIRRAMSKINLEEMSEKWDWEDHLSILKTKWEAIDRLHWELEALQQTSNETYEYLFNTTEQEYDFLRKKLNAKIWSNTHYQQATPKISIPEFTGMYNQWVSFKDLFLETVHRNPMLSNAQKMQHLKSKLKGEPERLIQHLHISTDNYESCWDILNQRYDNRRLLFTSLMNSLLNLPVIQQPNAHNLKKMHDVIIETLNGLTNMGIDIVSWDPILVHLMSQKLDAVTFSEYTKDLRNPRDIPNLHEFTTFLENKFMAFEAMKNRQREPTYAPKPGSSPSFYSSNKHNFPHKQESSKTYSVTTIIKCAFCNGMHALMQCRKFLDMDTEQRNATVTNLHICKNCLYSHGKSDCKSTKTCKECNKPPHTLLHNYNWNKQTNSQKTSYFELQPSTSSQPTRTSNHLTTDDMEILLTTAQLRVQSIDGTYVTLRALLDQGSQVNLITENAAQLLQLPRKRTNATISGVGTVSGDCTGYVDLSCKSMYSEYTFQTKALIMKKLINKLPTKSFDAPNWAHLQNLKLADPDFNKSRSVDLLLGADVYSEIIMDGVLKQDNQSPIAQHTSLGWILCGGIRTLNCHVTMTNLNQLTRFWQTEDITPNEKDIPANDYCETYFNNTTERSADGKYIVKMPFCSNFEEKLGKSKPTATSQYLQLEKRLSRLPKLAAMYRDFIIEYQELGHMQPSTSHEQPEYYLPHHGVLNENSSTTKLRVVFNASQKTSSGYSLNDLMEKGPNLQKDIQALIINWRKYRYAYTADIEKMYRCIFISEDQRSLQKILWRCSTKDRLQEMELSTVTYGIKCAPWLAMRTLKQLALDDGDKYPEAAKILLNDCYVDDVISGHNDLQSAKQTQNSLINLLKGAGMNLRKWSSNTPKLLEDLSADQISPKATFSFKDGETLKTLGLGWNPNTDTFNFNWDTEHSNKLLTKRRLLSEVSKLYDPLGWLSPVTVAAKLLFQRIWISKIGWDDALPEDIKREWLKLKGELQNIKNIHIHRWIGSTQETIDLYGFCDASKIAYSCVVYSRVMNESGQPVITLIAAKTRVVPLNQKTSLPRLELCGALLLSTLMEKITKAMPENLCTLHAFCDSQVVLAWLQGNPTRWEKFVANRVAKITNIIPATNWRYVQTSENPADCASRGLSPTKLIHFDLWWHGPTFLPTLQEQDEQMESKVFTTSIGETKKPSNLVPEKRTYEHHIHKLLNNCSSLTRLYRIIARVSRFITITRYKRQPETDYLTARELNDSAVLVIRYVQLLEFADEYEQLKRHKIVSKKSKIFKLNPYLDEDSLIRVGGRLKNSDLPPNMKNPIILPHSGKLTQLIIDHSHHLTLHGGARLTLAHVRQRYWIVGGNSAVKMRLRSCVLCHRYKPNDHNQLMAEIPRPRIVPSRPFSHTAMDFTGAVNVKINKGRGVKTSKGYIVIFVCMATKAVHIELTSDLSTDTFLAAFKRLCGRRGTPKHVYSDNGTNFVGASRVLKSEFENFKQLLTTEFFDEINKMEVQWHFNAPSWPSAGGLWEAAVKSMKHHLKRILGEQKLTYEELSTLLTEIEGCMNSRPLCPLTEDPEEFYNCLTPGHFLTGSPILSLPQSDCTNVRNIDIRKRWQLTTHMLQQFWKTWSNDYLTLLQSRSKWQKPSRNIQEGDIVLVKEDYLPPGRWALGRVIELHPGRDGYVRVTTVKTKSGVLKRPIIKLSPLPIDSSEQRSLHTQLTTATSTNKTMQDNS